MNTSDYPYRLDVTYASLSDNEIEAIWRNRSQGDSAVDQAILRQLVLRALDVIEPMCSEEGGGLGLLEHDLERASNEIALKLFAGFTGTAESATSGRSPMHSRFRGDRRPATAPDAVVAAFCR